MNKTKEQLDKAEEDFQTAYEEWYDTGSKDAWDKMFLLVLDCCTNIIKSKLKGVTCEDFDGKCLDSAMKCMENILKGDHPQKLSSYCYTRTLQPLYNKKTKFNDRAISLEGYYEDHPEL